MEECNYIQYKEHGGLQLYTVKEHGGLQLYAV